MLSVNFIGIIMKSVWQASFILSQCFLSGLSFAGHLPENFVYLKDIDSSIVQDIRYAGDHNFIGRPIQGYQSATCILTLPTAQALHKVQTELRKVGLSLKVYDCYRPQMAVNDFIQWSQQPDQQMKAEFYPRVNKNDFFKLGYVAEKSGHSRGSTVDLTIVALPVQPSAQYQPGQKLVACYAPYGQRFKDNSIDMGTGYDCMDLYAHSDNRQISQAAYQHRLLLRHIMIRYGFVPYAEEWWHFTYKKELFPNRYFNFPVK